MYTSELLLSWDSAEIQITQLRFSYQHTIFSSASTIKWPTLKFSMLKILTLCGLVCCRTRRAHLWGCMDLRIGASAKGGRGDPFQVGSKAGPEAVHGGKRHKFLKQAILVWDCYWETDNKLLVYKLQYVSIIYTYSIVFCSTWRTVKVSYS